MSELCPRFEKAMELISKRWVGLILSELLKGPKRFSEMEAYLPLSGRLLSDRLKTLEKEDIIVRKVYSEFPVRIEYSLTEKGESLKPIIKELRQWAEEWITDDNNNEKNPSIHGTF